MFKYLLNAETNEVATFIDKVVEWCATTGLNILTKLIVALLIWWISFKIINVVFKKLNKKLTEKKVDTTIRETAVGFGRKGLKLLILIVIVTYLGVEMSSIVALITSIGITVGLALQGSLSNFAGGVIILVMRPFRIGDFVEFGGDSGTVEKIQLFYTTLRTADNKVIIVPNSTASSTTITNYSMKDTRRVDMVFSIAYENDFRKAKRIINKAVENHMDMILSDPAPFVNIGAHGASSIDIYCRVWVKSADYWTLKFAMLEEIKLEFDRNGIIIPYNQVDVHIKDDATLPNPIDENDELVKEEIAFEKHAAEEKAEKLALKKAEEERIEQELENKKLSTKIKKIVHAKDKKKK